MALQCFDNGVQSLNAHTAPSRLHLRRPKESGSPLGGGGGGGSTRAPEPFPAAAAAESPVVAPLDKPPAVEPEMPFNPFRNAVPGISNAYEVFKTVLMLPISLVRLVAFALILVLGLAVTKLALLGARDVLTRPFPAWRRACLWPVRLLARALLFACGFHWIQIKGRPARRDEAPILVCNHVTFVDPVFIFYMHLPVIVTAQENLRYPLMGSIISAMQVIAINRACSDSRRLASAEIKRRAQCNDWSSVMIFPEATTTNGKSLVSFKSGAFAPGLPVQPMLVRYPYVHMDPSWVALGPSIQLLLFKLMTQFHNYMVVEYLPVLEPSPTEQKSPRLFTERVRLTMAKSLNVMVTEHSFEDLVLVLEAQRKAKDFSGTPVIEFGKFERQYKLTLKEAKAFYYKFRGLDTDGDGCVTLADFLNALWLPDCGPVRRTFKLFDGTDRGFFNFRQYVNGLAFVSRLEDFGETVQAAYGLCDRDGDGLLSFDDLAGSLQELIPSMSMKQVDKLWSSIGSSSSSGRFVDKTAFVGFLERNPEYVAVFLYARAEQQQKGSQQQ